MVQMYLLTFYNFLTNFTSTTIMMCLFLDACENIQISGVCRFYMKELEVEWQTTKFNSGGLWWNFVDKSSTLFAKRLKSLYGQV